MAPTRREFCTHACHAASLAAAGVLLQGCGSSNPAAPSNTPATNTPVNVPQLSTVTSTVSGGTVSITVDSGSPLATVGNAAITVNSLGTFLMAQTAQDTFAAMTAICTHENCTITGFNNSRFVCPCHGSQYSTGGTVLVGPATSPLRTYPTAFASGVLTFTV